MQTELFKELYTDPQIQVQVVTKESTESQVLGNGLNSFTFGLADDR